jgi:hypothetical protein
MNAASQSISAGKLLVVILGFIDQPVAEAGPNKPEERAQCSNLPESAAAGELTPSEAADPRTLD